MATKKNSFKKYLRIFWFLTGGLLFSIILVITLTAFGLFGDMPTFEELENPKSSLATEVYSADGVLLGKCIDPGHRIHLPRQYQAVAGHL